MPTSTSPIEIDLVSQLKNTPVSTQPTVVVLIGGLTLTDGLGGFYRWAWDDTSVEDTRFFNVVTSNMSATGRWLRVFQRVRPLAGGYLVSNGGFKEFFMPGVINASGQISINLTMDGTATGAAIFSEVWTTQGDATGNPSTVNDTIIGSKKSLSTDLKTLVFQFVKGGNTTLSLIAGLIIPGLTTAPTGTAVVVRVSGI